MVDVQHHLRQFGLQVSTILLTNHTFEAIQITQIYDFFLSHILRKEVLTFLQGFGNPRRPAELSHSTGASS